MVLGESLPGTEADTPMLHVMWRRSPNQCEVSMASILSQKLCARARAALRPVAGSTMRNSSPPSRPKNAGSLTAERTVAATTFNTSSPVEWPSWSLIALK